MTFTTFTNHTLRHSLSMKKNYIAPRAEVIGLFTETSILAGSELSINKDTESEQTQWSHKTIWSYGADDAED